MSVQELEARVTELSREELSVFSKWFEEYLADQVDQRLEEDIKAGRFDQLAQQAREDFRAGRCTPL